MKRQPSQETTFFRLTPSVRDRLLEINLTAAEWRIWCYLVSLDPFGDRGAKFIPAELMLKCKIKKTTYFSAKAKFQKLGLFDFRDGVTKVVNLQTSLISTALAHCQQVLTIESEISESEFGNSESHSEISESEFGNSESRKLKTLPRNASGTPQTLQTYSDFKRSLSESEGENFLIFVKEKISNLEKPINDLEAWLASKNAAKQNRWEVYYRNYQEEKPRRKPKTTNQADNSENLSPSKMQRAIARFQEKMKIKESKDEPEVKEINSDKLQQQNEALNKLLNNPPEYEQRTTRNRQEQMAEMRRQQAEMRLANKEAAEKRAKQQENLEDLEQRRQETLRYIERMNQQQQSQNTEIDEEDW